MGKVLSPYVIQSQTFRVTPVILKKIGSFPPLLYASTQISRHDPTGCASKPPTLKICTKCFQAFKAGKEWITEPGNETSQA